MSRPYNFSPVNWGGQEPGAHGTSHVLNEAGTAGRGRQNPHYPPVRSFTMTGPSFEDVNDFIAAVQSADPGVAGSLLVYGNSRTARAMGTGLAARGRRR